ncbi:hypothetical protein E2C01_079943 [Portunus trituberculatus]|uniref:Uncharacterized protein n=1 Tax=Portunus trituberculatus TaxID=210409 RepID=A0A5B7IKU9_PORTR|nr:hypothetical protein [Portunus trituberculatus]
MAEDLNGQLACPEQPAAARESSLLMDGAASSPGSSGSQSSSKLCRRVCSRSDCFRVLGSFFQDLHSVCVNCRDICNPGKRCDECSSWSSDKVLAAYKCQCGLMRRRCSKAKHSHSSVAPYCNVSCDVGTSQSVKAPPIPGTRVSLAAFVLSDVHGGSEISFQDVSVLSRDELTAGDSASQQGILAEEVLASVNSLVASQIADLSGSVLPAPATDPSPF